MTGRSATQQRKALYLEYVGANPKKSVEDVARDAGFAVSTVQRWRKLDEDFRNKDLALRGNPPSKRGRLKLPASIPKNLATFLQVFHETDDRQAARDAAGLRWAEIEAALKANTDFAAEYRLLMQERNVRLEDAQYREGLNGQATSGRAYLAANDPRYRGRGLDDGAPPAGGKDGTTDRANSWLAGISARAAVAPTAEDLTRQADA